MWRGDRMITSLRANGSHECAPDDRLRQAIHRPRRHCERSEAIHLAAQRKNGLLRRFAPRNDGNHTFAPSRRDAPEALLEFSAQRGRGKRCTFAWAAAKLPKAPGSQKRLSEDFSSLRLTRASVPAAIVATQSVRHRSPVAEERPNFSPWVREAIAA